MNMKGWPFERVDKKVEPTGGGPGMGPGCPG